VGGIPGIPLYDKFLKSMIDLNNTQDVDLIQSLHPSYPDEPDYEPMQIRDDPDFFSISSDAVVPFTYDATIAVGLSACHAYSIVKSKTDFFDGQTMFESFKSLRFEGASGVNAFDETGSRRASSARFTLLNVVEDTTYDASLDPPNTIRFKTVETDVFRRGEWSETVPYVFNDGSTIPPSDLPPVRIDNNYLGPYLRGMGYFMAAVILCLSFGSFVWTYRHREARVVKASQPIFLCLISAGCTFMALAILFLSFDDEVVSEDVCTAFCVAVPWVAVFGWILAFSAIFTKTKRVNAIFHHPQQFKRIKVTTLDVMKPFLVMLAVAGITLLVWTIVSPPVWGRTVTQVDIYSREIETKGFCNFDGSMPYAVILLVVLLGTVVRSLYEAYIARNVSTEFAESDYIFLVLCIVLLVSFMGIPTMIIARDQPQARFFTAVSIIFVICLAILVFIFVPKAIAHRQQNRKEHDVNAIRRPSQPMNGRINVTGLEYAGGSGDFGPRTPVGLEYAGDSGGAIRRSSKSSTRPSLVGSVGTNDDEGIRVLLHPKEVDGLKVQVRNLIRENQNLNESRNTLETMLADSKTKITQMNEDFRRLLPDSDTGLTPPSVFPALMEGSNDEEDYVTSGERETGTGPSGSLDLDSVDLNVMIDDDDDDDCPELESWDRL
jgi:7 transmembrane sweet-taste receptor of 3 GCPR